MERCLSKSDQLRLVSSGIETVFTIEETFKPGGSCTAYVVSYCEDNNIKHKGILKEFFPSFLNTGEGPLRSGTNLCIPDKFAGLFAEELERFKHTYRVINDYLSNNLSATNFHTVQLGLYTGNNTAYTLVSCDYGKTYNLIRDDSLHSMFKLMYSVTKAVEMYHHAGFLHLDIKPGNILVLDEITDVVKLFDFDSLVPLQQYKDRTAEYVPNPGEYYVPELSNMDLRNIGIHTDIFEIGAVIFNRLFGRYPDIEDIRHNAIYPFDEAEAFLGVSPKAKFEIEQLLRKTIQISKRNRYQTTEQLKQQLKKIINLVGSASPYLMDMPKWQPSGRFIGRQESVRELDQRLKKDGYVFIKGVGGLGKSELVKYYVKEMGQQYHTIQFCKYDGGLKNVVAALSVNGIDEHGYGDFEELVKAKNKVLHNCDDHTLLIVDNFNVTHDKFLRDFLPSGPNSFKVIFTTRCKMAADYYADKMMLLPRLSMAECKLLYRSHSGLDGDEQTVEQIIEMVDHNTLVLVLLAETMKQAGKTPAEMLTALREQELGREQAVVFHEYDYSQDEIEEYNKINAHLNVIFDVSDMSAVRKEILKNMSLVSQHGITVADFLSGCASAEITENEIISLADQSWLEFREDRLVMHPTVSDLIDANTDIPTGESYEALMEAMYEFCVTHEYVHITMLMEQLSCALHLERRHKNRDEEEKLIVKLLLSKIYTALYQFKNAKKTWTEYLEIANKNQDSQYLIYAYYGLGQIEQLSGTLTAAVEYFQKAMKYASVCEKETFEYKIDCLCSIGQCMVDNSDMKSAYKVYKNALQVAEKYRQSEQIYEIAKELIEICLDLELYREAKKYKKIAQAYQQTVQQGTEDDLCDQIERSESIVDYTEALNTQVQLLQQVREDLGEDSPAYQDAAKYNWIVDIWNGEKEQAVQKFAQSVAFIEETYGAESMEMAQILVGAANASAVFEPSEALKFAERAISICAIHKQEKSKAALEARLAKASILFTLGKYETAKELLDTIDYTLFSGNQIQGDIGFTLASILFEVGEYDRAEQICVNLVNRRGIDETDRVFIRLIYASILEQRGDADKAEQLCEATRSFVENRKPVVTELNMVCLYYRLRAKLAYRRGRYSEAIDTLEGYISMYPDDQRNSSVLFAVYLELGLYYSYDGQEKNAQDIYAKAEKILHDEHMPAERFVLLYNNIYVNYNNMGNPVAGEQYLKKIADIMPEVLQPKTFQDAIICNNFGWVAFCKREWEQAQTMFLRAVKTIEKLRFYQAPEYILTLHNLSLSYIGQKQYSKCYKLYKKAFKLYDEKRMDQDGQLRGWMSVAYCQALLLDGRLRKAMSFVEKEDEYLEKRFGSGSLRRATLLVETGAYFKIAGSHDCMKLYQTASDVIKTGGHEKTLLNAQLMNYVGVYHAEAFEDYVLARKMFEQSKQLYEELGCTDGEEYATLLANIEYISDSEFDQLIKSMADTLMKEKKTEE